MSCVDFSARESRELTRIGKRRDWLLDFAKLWECDTSPCHFALEPSASRKAVRGRPALRKHFMRNPVRDSRAELGLQRSSSESPTTSSLPNDHFLMWNI